MPIDNIAKRIDKFDNNYQIENEKYNCFTQNLSNYARSYISQKSGILNGM